MAYYYYQSIRKTIIQFLDVFKAVQIARYSSNGTLVGYRKVPIKFGPKEKVWYWLHERKDDEILPMMSVTITSIDHAPERQTNKMRNVIKSETISSGEISKFINPIPYNISFALSIWSLHMVDIDQILEQILPFFTPNIFVKVNIPELDATLDIKVVFLACSPDVSMEMAEEDIRVLKWNIDFIVHTYLFQPLLTSNNMVKKIINKMYTNDTAWSHRFTESAFTSGAGPDDFENESMYMKGVPTYFDEPTWEASTEYEIGDVIKPSDSNGYIYEVESVTIPGKSGTIEPTWPETKNTPVIDGNVVWLRYQHEEYKKLTELEYFGEAHDN
jgi:hypothetical protein